MAVVLFEHLSIEWRDPGTGVEIMSKSQNFKGNARKETICLHGNHQSVLLLFSSRHAPDNP